MYDNSSEKRLVATLSVTFAVR